MTQPDDQPSIKAGRHSPIYRAFSKLIALGLLYGASRAPQGWWILLYFFWLFAMSAGVVIVHNHAASARRLRLDCLLLDADQSPIHTNEFVDRLSAGRKSKARNVYAALLIAVLATTSVALALLLDRSDVLLGLGLISGVIVMVVAGSFAAKRSALDRFKIANASSADRKIAAIRQRHAQFEVSLTKANADRNERENLKARVATMRRDGLVGAARLRDSFDL